MGHRINIERENSDKMDIVYVIKTPQASFGKYSLQLNNGKDKQKFKILNVTIAHIGSNYKCRDSIRKSAQDFSETQSAFGKQRSLTFNVNI